MKIVTKSFLAPLLAAGLALGHTTSALSQATDSATSLITLQFDTIISIDNVDPITISNPMPGNSATGDDRFCVAGNGFSTYGITFQNDGTDPTYSLIGSDGTSITYSVVYQNDGVIPQQANAGVPITNNTLQASNCANDNATFFISIPVTEWEPNQSSAPFSGTLRITVEAE
ncbi:hypothetical protein [uncultured Microbulbifer sp.]|uniref:hypothetical protein n=1 Tax=uncultured Microbulbifer sp. TaxID=348147 RepID=UPI00262E32F7|nr:hypothetical protein [uncultured Microbulbifer sp.]